MTTITIPHETFDLMREKIEKALIYLAHSGKFSRSSAKTVLNEALSAAKAVSEPKVKLIPTAEELGTPVQPCKPLCELCVKRGYRECAKTAKIDTAMVGAHLGVADQPVRLLVKQEEWSALSPAAQKKLRDSCEAHLRANAKAMADFPNAPLLATHPQASEPAGWKLVPIRPTVEMLDAANASDREYSLRAFGAGVHMCQSGEDHWAAMLAAAPEAKK